MTQRTSYFYVKALPLLSPLSGLVFWLSYSQRSFMWHGSALCSFRSRLPSYQPIFCVVAAGTVVGDGYWGLRPTATVLQGRCPPSSSVFRRPMIFPLGCRTLTKGWLWLPIFCWSLRLAFRPVYVALSLQNSSVVLYSDIVLLAAPFLPY